MGSVKEDSSFAQCEGHFSRFLTSKASNHFFTQPSFPVPRRSLARISDGGLTMMYAPMTEVNGGPD